MDPQLPLPAGLWLALFPITFILHFAEEYWGGGGYIAYLYRLRGVVLPVSRFLKAQAVGLVWFSIPLAWLTIGDFPYFVTLMVSGFMVCNGLSHTVTAVWDRHYGPGLIASILLWIPLGIINVYLLYGYAPTWCWALGWVIGALMNGGLAAGTMLSEKLINRGTAASR